MPRPFAFFIAATLLTAGLPEPLRSQPPAAVGVDATNVPGPLNGTGAPAPAADPNDLILEAIQRAVWGPTLQCQMTQTTRLFDTEMIGIGRYAHRGSGEGALRLVMRMSSGQGHENFIQISDGRLLWTRMSDDVNPSRVYLDRVRQVVGPASRNPKDALLAAMALAIGGQPELLRGLYDRYRWYKIWSAEVDGRPVWQLVGTLRTEVPPHFPHTTADALMLNPNPNEFLPTDTRLTLLRGGPENLVPLQVEYFRRELGAEGQLLGFVAVSTLEYRDIVVGHILENSEFQFTDHSRDVEDETDRYLVPDAVAEANF